MNFQRNIIHIIWFCVLSCIVYYPLAIKAENSSQSSEEPQKSSTDNNRDTSDKNTSQVSEKVKNFRFPPLGSAQRVTTGGTRGDNFKILVPSTISEENNIYSTYSQYPTFVLYFDSPQSNPRETTLKFTLSNSDNTQVYEAYSQVKKSGIYTFQLPQDSQGLTPNTDYIWQFSLVYGSQNQNTFLSDAGSIQRQSVSPKIEQQLQQASEPEKAIIHGENQVWYDTVSHLTNLYCSNPDEYQATWESLVINNKIIDSEKFNEQSSLNCLSLDSNN